MSKARGTLVSPVLLLYREAYVGKSPAATSCCWACIAQRQLFLTRSRSLSDSYKSGSGWLIHQLWYANTNWLANAECWHQGCIFRLLSGIFWCLDLLCTRKGALDMRYPLTCHQIWGPKLPSSVARSKFNCGLREVCEQAFLPLRWQTSLVKIFTPYSWHLVQWEVDSPS